MLSRVNATVVVIAGLAVFLTSCATLVALYALAPHRPDITPIVAGIPGALAFLVTLAVAGKQRQHGAQLAQITHQTNGVLTSRIRGAVGAALADYATANQKAAIAHEAAHAEAARTTSTAAPRRRTKAGG